MGATFRHPRHRWRGFHTDRSSGWRVVTFGFWTVEYLPRPAAERLLRVLATLRKGWPNK